MPYHKVVGVVLNVADDLMHGAELGMRQVYGDIGLWLDSGYFEILVSGLLERGFDVYVTADHGNKECVGEGLLNEGNLVETRGMRVRIYKDASLMNVIRTRFPGETKELKTTSLPEGYHPAVMTGNGFFGPRGTTSVVHGGVSFEEVVVPFVRIIKEQ